MTRDGKCDICRQRKVKCDEVKPVCGAYHKKRRSCTYLSATRRPPMTFFNTSISHETRDLVTNCMETPGIPPIKARMEPSSALALRTTSIQALPTDLSFVIKPGRRTKRKDRHGYDATSEDQSARQQYVPAPKQHLTCQSTSLILRWKSFSEMVCPGELQPYLIGEYLEGMPSYIGTLRSIDLSLSCAIDSTLAVLNRSDGNYIKACELTVKSIHALKLDVGASNHGPRTWAMILLATALVYFAETMLHTYNNTGRIHQIPATTLLLAASKNGTECDEYILQIFLSLVPCEFLPSLVAGIDSPFDTPVWLSHPLPPLPNTQYHRADEVDLYVKQRYIRIPRLVRLIRYLRNEHTNDALRHEAYLLAHELYTNTLYDWIDELFNLGLLWYSHNNDSFATGQGSEPATAEYSVEQSRPQTSSLHFSTVRLYLRFISYYKLRCLLSGLVQTLCSIPPSSSRASSTFDFCLTAVQAEDVHAASMIAACETYAVLDPSPLKMRRSRLVWPALYSYGAWCRLQTRAERAIATAANHISAQAVFDDTLFDNAGSNPRKPTAWEPCDSSYEDGTTPSTLIIISHITVLGEDIHWSQGTGRKGLLLWLKSWCYWTLGCYTRISQGLVCLCCVS